MNAFEYMLQDDVLKEYKRITNETIEEMKSRDVDILVSFGVGGSVKGAKAVINGVKGKIVDKKVVFLGEDISEHYLDCVCENILKGKKLAIGFNSLSATTVETVTAYEYILSRGLDIAYTFSVTKESRVDKLSESFDKNITLNDCISGRYSVFTPIGLIPIAFEGISIDEFLDGAKDSLTKNLSSEMYNTFMIKQFKRNTLQVVSCTSKRMSALLKWYQQLVMESTGKDRAGLLVLPVEYPADLHSIEQYLQDGQLQFTEIMFEHDSIMREIILKTHSESLLASFEVRKNASDFGFVMSVLCSFVVKLCTDYFNVNPFDQPGVEVYKNIAKEVRSKC